MRFIKFNDQQVDSFLFMELSDLAKVLTKRADTELEYSVHSYLNPLDQKIFVSHFWDHRDHTDMVSGLKSDLFLRSIGNYFHTHYEEMTHFLTKISSNKLSSFAKQLFILCEDLRLEEICKKERPGTRKVFEKRRVMYRRHFQSQRTINSERSIYTDALFNTLYLKLTADTPLEEITFSHESIQLALPYLSSEIAKVFDAKDTREIMTIVLTIVEVLEDLVEKDMLNTYFFLPDLNYDEVKLGSLFDEMKRKSKLKNNDVLIQDKNEEKDVHEDKLPTWHRETSKPTKSFLQFDLEQGTKTNIKGDAAREGEDGDQALGTVQGASKKAAGNDYSKMEALENNREDNDKNGQYSFGKENKFAYPVFQKPIAPTVLDIESYKTNKDGIVVYQKKLKQMIQKTLEHKKTQPRTDLHIGRLNKKLIRLFTDENSRLFYKKEQPSPEIDAVFTLLVDCSASMFDKMNQTKLGITLFHEALKSVRVQHQVVGFWEDTSDATATKQPNHFYTVVPFEDSLKRQTGPEIMQLQPEEDNRDGYAIRHMTKQLSTRYEKQKFLLVFSDGEPAAMGYEKNGIIDTHEAVIEARKRGIEVINVFLANGEIDEGQQKMIQNIYGKYSILVHKIEELPEQLFPLLKKLLLKTI
ncbi:nitric oxide reductase activation protein NorD [Metabacillus herbersteinensis]|uniref:Nitric oxide reductase activation protein NorD n=1 Tax=Metabacillus herbersteinensis TaxID=283816 RepID=A0ABV6GJP8_9BACI